MKKLYYSLLTILFFISTSQLSQAQTQKGQDIDGEATDDRFGYSISMPDANTIAIGSVSAGNNGKGQVRIYNWNGTKWVQKGSNIDGENTGDQSGRSISMPDANTIAIGAHLNNGNGLRSGHVRIYKWNGVKWKQKGIDIDGETAYDNSGMSVSMPDSNTIAIGARQNSGNGNASGHVRIYNWNGNKWMQKGYDIDGKAAGDWSGYSVSMPDANTIAIGSFRNSGNGFESGQVRVYKWNGNFWVQKGMDIVGEAAGDWSGYSISMPDSITVAIGAPYNNENGEKSGHVRIYKWNGTKWIQKGGDIDGETVGDQSGFCVSMSDSNTIAIGAPFNHKNGKYSGQVRIYNWNGSKWIQKGNVIKGNNTRENLGYSVSMPDSRTIGIGAYGISTNIEGIGGARVFEFCKVTLTSSIVYVECDDSFTVPSGRATYTENGVYYDTLLNVNFCDSILKIDLRFAKSSTATIDVEACQGYKAPSGAIYYNSGTFIDTIPNFAGCDSIITINYDAIPHTSSSLKVLECENSYTLPSGRATYTTGGIYYDTLINSNNCDSILEIDLQFGSSTSTLNINSCKAFTAPSGAILTESGTYIDTIPNKVGCDSIITINYTALNKSSSSIKVFECDTSYTVPSGKATYTSSGVYYDTLVNSNNCDSILEIDLRFAKHTTSTINVTSCQPYTSSNGEIYPRTGTYFDTVPNFAGCDSIITIHFVLENSDTAISPTLFAPNAFSPNGDGINDIFKIGYCGYTNFECIVYGSTGQIVAFSHNPDAIWDGTFNGIDYPIGTYKYSIKATDYQGKEVIYSGTVQLLR